MASFNAVIPVSFLLLSFVLSSWGTSIEMPPECEGQQYCETKPDNYPDLALVIKDLQSKEFLRPPRYTKEDEKTNNDDLNCDTKVSIIRPYIIKTNATMKLVVQHPNVFEQWIKQTDCLNEGSKCFQGVGIGMGFNTTCTPTMGTIKMYLYDPLKEEKERLEHVPVSFPVCCSCSIKSNI
ncbi:hypothetical protein ABMA27_000697 [Loxostege sticticalis]|uniref:Spaetzle domain-containing protein n=1 Tax=Loxostege sticticalis TaxID=481309 RepID=A0ABR3I000_LOXSC